MNPSIFKARWRFNHVTGNNEGRYFFDAVVEVLNAKQTQTNQTTFATKTNEQTSNNTLFVQSLSVSFVPRNANFYLANLKVDFSNARKRGRQYFLYQNPLTDDLMAKLNKHFRIAVKQYEKLSISKNGQKFLTLPETGTMYLQDLGECDVIDFPKYALSEPSVVEIIKDGVSIF